MELIRFIPTGWFSKLFLNSYHYLNVFFCISSFRRSYFVNLIEKTIENLTKVLNCNVQFEDSECFKSTSAVNSHFNKRQKIRNY